MKLKNAIKCTGLTLAATLIAASGFLAHEWYADKPYFFRSFLDRDVMKIALGQPETLTTLGLLESVGITGHNARLNDASPEQTEQLLSRVDHLYQALLQYDDKHLSEDSRLSKQITLYLLDLVRQGKPYIYHNYPVNQLFGVQNGYPSFMQAQHQVHNTRDAEHYLARLAKVKTKFDQILKGLAIRKEKGILPPRFVIERVQQEMNDFVATPVTDNILFTSFVTKLEQADAISALDRSQLLDAAARNIRHEVYPAYQGLIDHFSGLREHAGNDDGYWHLPDGDKAYALALKFFTTTDYSPEQIHQMGLSEVERLQVDILALLARQGMDTSQGFSPAIEALAAQPRFYYSDDDAGRNQILEDYQAILDDISSNLDQAFRIRPQAGMEVVRIPKFREKTAPGAYYQPPSLDGRRPGRFFANLHDIKATPKYGMRTLAYHEGIPGHHFQIALGLEQEGLPLLRRMAPFIAYTEGWALYAEYLAWELGFLDDPLDNLGRLQAELLRAVRLVVDTGLHHHRWNRQQAIDYMKVNTGMAMSDVVSEVERYIVMPGQATAYKVGMMKLLELRRKAQAELGEKFDLRDFHDVVLKNGAMPLELLEQQVNGYIDSMTL